MSIFNLPQSVIDEYNKNVLSFFSIADEWVRLFIEEAQVTVIREDLVDADASNNSVIDTRSLKVQLQESYKKLEARLNLSPILNSCEAVMV
jgi:hypothetical protein